MLKTPVLVAFRQASSRRKCFPDNVLRLQEGCFVRQVRSRTWVSRGGVSSLYVFKRDDLRRQYGGYGDMAISALLAERDLFRRGNQYHA